MTINEAAIDRKNNLNIIRLIASLMVLYMHSFAICLGVQDKDIFNVLTNHKELAGGIAVYIFFIISGFLICRSYDRTSSIAQYFKARFLRIWPLLFLVTIICAFVLGPIISEYSFEQYIRGDIKGFLKNIFFISSNTLLPGVYSDHYNHSLNGSLWTLMYEVMWYILVAILSPVWKRFKAVIPACSIGLAIVYLVFTYYHAISVATISGEFILNFAKLGLFFTVGMCFYLYGDKIILSAKVCLLAFTVLVLGIIFADFIITFAIAGSYIIFYLAFQKKCIASWYDKVGDLSYGIYIMAFPIQQTVLDYMGIPTEHYNTLTMNPYLNMLITLVVLVPLAYLSWHFVEEPCLKLKNKSFFKAK